MQMMSRRRKSSVKIYWRMSRNSTSDSRSNLLHSVGTVVVAMDSVIVNIMGLVTEGGLAAATEGIHLHRPPHLP